MTEYELVIQHLQTQRNDAHNMCVNVMVAKSLLEEKVTQLETELQDLKTTPKDSLKVKHKGKNDGDV